MTRWILVSTAVLIGATSLAARAEDRRSGAAVKVSSAAQGPPKAAVAPPQIPRGGFINRIGRWWRNAPPTPADQLVQKLKNAQSREEATSLVRGFFRDPQTRQENLSQTSIHDLGRIVSLAAKKAGPVNRGDADPGGALVLAYLRHWQPQLKNGGFWHITNLDAGRGAKARQGAALLSQYERFFRNRPLAQLESDLTTHRDRVFEDLFYLSDKQANHLLTRYAQVLGKTRAQAKVEVAEWRRARNARKKPGVVETMSDFSRRQAWTEKLFSE
jgi:hypothetical protein